jgi:hypothetical protein
MTRKFFFFLFPRPQSLLIVFRFIYLFPVQTETDDTRGHKQLQEMQTRREEKLGE